MVVRPQRAPAPMRPKPRMNIAQVEGLATLLGKVLLISGINMPVPGPVKRPTARLSDP